MSERYKKERYQRDNIIPIRNLSDREQNDEQNGDQNGDQNERAASSNQLTGNKIS
ncbi:hypothetical protein LHL20_01955 [Alteromonas sp. McT4-15]|uniref:hypothetical protein n=1 Tax=Alteromonas sp. McT4-15 TaxID=2881256 RepID=UPI001CF91169|nr:hypothetical protein [Alteromonas sp. McT4-15]MCB4435003.1 hypothetical protein [Alteromonas sp. McT4-15]